MSAEASRGQALSSQEVLDRLREAYPKAFTVPPTPLQIEVRKAIRKNDGLADISNVMFTRAMRRWVRQDAYLQAICDRVPRVDLDGQPWGEVSDDAVAVATKVLRMRKKKQERRGEPNPGARPTHPSCSPGKSSDRAATNLVGPARSTSRPPPTCRSFFARTEPDSGRISSLVPVKQHDPFPALHEDGSNQTFTEIDLGAQNRLRVTRRHNGRVSLRRYHLEDTRIPQGIELYDNYLIQLVGALGLIATVTSGDHEDE